MSARAFVNSTLNRSTWRHQRSRTDEVPNENLTFAQTHPDRLATTARLFGLQPPPIATSRVLELGCASGGNLIPMAFNFPPSSVSICHDGRSNTVSKRSAPWESPTSPSRSRPFGTSAQSGENSTTSSVTVCSREWSRTFRTGIPGSGICERSAIGDRSGGGSPQGVDAERESASAAIASRPSARRVSVPEFLTPLKHHASTSTVALRMCRAGAPTPSTRVAGRNVRSRRRSCIPGVSGAASTITVRFMVPGR